MRPEQKRVKQLLTEAISLLCRNSLQFKEEVTVEGLLGITLDKSDIFLVSINETVQQTLRESAAEVRAEKRNVDHNSDDGHTPKKRRRRRGSREGSSSPPPSPPADDDPRTSNPAAETSDHVNIKEEKSVTDENGQHSSQNWPEDGRKFNPAHDSTSVSPPDNKTLIKKNQDFSTSSTPRGEDDANDSRDVQVKQEAQEEEEDCFLIDSDSEDASDTSRSLPPDHPDLGSSLGAHSWPSGGEQPGFNLSELDMISAANFQQQFGNLAVANNMGNVTWDPNQMQGQGQGQDQPSTSGAMDGTQRIMCSKCDYVTLVRSNMRRHYTTVHLKIKKIQCPLCGKSFTQNQALRRHFASSKNDCVDPGDIMNTLNPGYMDHGDAVNTLNPSYVDPGDAVNTLNPGYVDPGNAVNTLNPSYVERGDILNPSFADHGDVVNITKCSSVNPGSLKQE